MAESGSRTRHFQNLQFSVELCKDGADAEMAAKSVLTILC